MNDRAARIARMRSPTGRPAFIGSGTPSEEYMVRDNSYNVPPAKPGDAINPTTSRLSREDIEILARALRDARRSREASEDGNSEQEVA